MFHTYTNAKLLGSQFRRDGEGGRSQREDGEETHDDHSG